MRSFAPALLLLVFSACGGSSPGQGSPPRQVHYDQGNAVRCILSGGESGIVPDTVANSGDNVAGEFELKFPLSDSGYAVLDVVVGYSSDRATARIGARSLRKSLPLDVQSARAWERHDGNVVFEAFGPLYVRGFEENLPSGVTPADLEREVERVSGEVREALDDCLTKAGRD